MVENGFISCLSLVYQCQNLVIFISINYVRMYTLQYCKDVNLLHLCECIQVSRRKGIH